MDDVQSKAGGARVGVPPPLAGATRAIVVDRITDLENREAVTDLYARSVLVLALHQEVSGAPQEIRQES